VTEPAPLDPEQRAGLLSAKLHALVRDHTGHEGGERGGHAGAATLRRDHQGWFLADARPERAVGPSLAWARQQGVSELHLVVDDPVAAGVAARRGTHFELSPTVWSVQGRALRRVEAAPHAPAVPGPVGVDMLVALIEGAGLEVVVEHGRVTGEWRGLEVAQVVHDPGGPRLEVGVGRNDRDAFTIMHGEVPAAEAIGAVADAVRTHRRPDNPAHPLTRLVPERWLRWHLLNRPELVGARHLDAVPPVLPRASVTDVVPAAAAGLDDEGRPVLVVCSVGVDLDVVPEATDHRARWEPEQGTGVRLVLVLPARDALPVTRDLAAAATRPVEVRPVPGDWRSQDPARW